MKKLLWILVLCVVIIAGVYFMVSKGNVANESESNSIEKIPQPPELPK